MKKTSFRKKGLSSFASSLIAIIVGLAAGLVILFVSNPQNAVRGLGVILAGGFNNGMKGLGEVLYYATPIIVTGLSVGFAFKTGLFNIGVVGQLMVGGFAAVVVGVAGDFFGPAQWLAALVCGILAGAVWGMLPGLFKAFLNVNEVISSIMMNYIGMYGINYLIKNLMYFDAGRGRNVLLVYDKMRNLTVNVDQAAVIPSWGLTDIFYTMVGEYKDSSSVNGGILIAVFLAIVMYVVLNRTTFGYELKACGHNRNASRYAGINEKRSIVLSMAIAGALAGAAGGLMYLAPPQGLHLRVEEILAVQGFNGIPVALLGLSNPIGIIFSGLFVAYITVGGSFLQSLKYMKEIIDIIIGTIIYFSAFSLFVKDMLGRLSGRHKHRDDAKASPDVGDLKEGGQV